MKYNISHIFHVFVIHFAAFLELLEKKSETQ